ncbi:hypothetical protein ACJJTC_009521 [Scirpophaga incertulas]
MRAAQFGACRSAARLRVAEPHRGLAVTIAPDGYGVAMRYTRSTGGVSVHSRMRDVRIKSSQPQDACIKVMYPKLKWSSNFRDKNNNTCPCLPPAGNGVKIYLLLHGILMYQHTGQM